MLNQDRNGKLHGQVFIQKDFPLPADGRVFLGGMYSFNASGRLVRAANDAEQAGKAIVYALESVDNTGGQDGRKRARCMVHGLAVVPAGSLTAAEIGKSVHAIDDDTLAATSSEGRVFGTLVALDGGLAEVLI